jgi:fatty acid desaturase
MQDYTTEQELKDRLSLIETMIAEGRRNTASWGWTFVLWGVAYYLAIAWSAWGHSAWAWPATVLIAVIVTIVAASLKTGNHPETTLGRQSVLSGLPWEFRCFCPF